MLNIAFTRNLSCGPIKPRDQLSITLGEKWPYILLDRIKQEAHLTTSVVFLTHTQGYSNSDHKKAIRARL